MNAVFAILCIYEPVTTKNIVPKCCVLCEPCTQVQKRLQVFRLCSTIIYMLNIYNKYVGALKVSSQSLMIDV